ncbi:hypothetical protein ACTMTJ_08185 [Phytohabitans sp. LJ34]
MTTRWKILVTGATGKVGCQLVQGRADPASMQVLDHAEAFR